MVFAWGTNYKLSLYKIGSESPPAKVCTRGSDAAKDALSAHANIQATTQAHLELAAFFVLPTAVEGHPSHWVQDESVDDRSPLGKAPVLYLRPPPAELRLLT
jgi:hypothetical protein